MLSGNVRGTSTTIMFLISSSIGLFNSWLYRLGLWSSFSFCAPPMDIHTWGKRQNVNYTGNSFPERGQFTRLWPYLCPEGQRYAFAHICLKTVGPLEARVSRQQPQPSHRALGEYCQVDGHELLVLDVIESIVTLETVLVVLATAQRTHGESDDEKQIRFEARRCPRVFEDGNSRKVFMISNQYRSDSSFEMGARSKSEKLNYSLIKIILKLSTRKCLLPERRRRHDVFIVVTVPVMGNAKLTGRRDSKERGTIWFANGRAPLIADDGCRQQPKAKAIDRR